MTLQTERELFDACMDLAPGERTAWLEQHCGDPALRERILRLLQVHDSATAHGSLERSPLVSARRVGPFDLLERIGEGAMGEVWLAEQTAPVRRRVAVKIVKAGTGSREVLARFELERQALAMMSHPNIAHIVEAGTTDDARPYFAMEYVPGIALTRYCDQHRLGIDERLALFLLICEAVQHAHQKGVIHRDLKPGNLLVMEIDGRPVPKVIDFGIAKAVALDHHQPSRAHTMLGHLIGTPEYMSPEQAQLSPLDVDTRADVYSLGVVLHELLTGTLPFKTSDPNATPAMLVQELLTHDPAAPSVRVQVAAPEPQQAASNRGLSPRQLAARLAGDLDWIVLKALEKDRNRRYGSPSELAADVRRHLADEPVVAGPPSTLYRMRKFATRHRLPLTLAAGVFIAAIVFGAMMAWQAHEVALQRDEARFHAQRAEASSEFMSLMLEEVGPEGRPLSPIELVDKGVQLLDRRYGADPQFAARMLMQMSRRYMDLGSTEKSTQVLARALTIAREVNDPDLLADVECTTVRAELDASRHDLARQHLQGARAALARLPNPPVVTQVDCLRAEADIADDERDFATAETNLRKAQLLLERDANTRGLLYHAVLTDLGGVLFRTSRFREALALNELTAEALDRNGRGGTLGRVTVAMNRASLLMRLGEVSAAEAAGAESIRRSQRLRGNEPATPQQAISYGITLNRLGRQDEALELLTAAREQAHTLGAGFWEVIAEYHRARALVLARRPDEARPLLDSVRTAWSTNATANRDRLADLYRTQAEVELLQGNVSQARAAIDKALAEFGYPKATPAPFLSNALTTASRVYAKSGQLDEAESYANAALSISESIARDPRQSADVGEALFVLASVKRARGDVAAATAYVERAVEALSNSLGREHELTRAASNLLAAGTPTG
ncbi:MAG TPA: protein kinase [Steroidobacteraceae bacterium]|nr:protein kinase [Steroidobacteraceae bacterium]